MFSSIKDDLRNAFSFGHMVTRLMIINVSVFVVLALIEAFTRNLQVYGPVRSFVAFHNAPMELLFKPWTIISYMFVHEGFWHLAMNMIGLNIFGKIVGDLVGDRKVFPIYFLGGLAGAFLFLLLTPLMGNLSHGLMVGASASVLALAMVGALVAPDYNIRLMIIGNVRLKYIVLFFIISDLLASQGFSNAGGHVAHLGGILFGALYMYFMREGKDVGEPIANGLDWLSNINSPQPKVRKRKSVLKVEHRSDKLASSSENRRPSKPKMEIDFDVRVDQILDKIKQKGYDKLTQEEKDFLNKASQK